MCVFDFTLDHPLRPAAAPAPLPSGGLPAALSTCASTTLLHRTTHVFAIWVLLGMQVSKTDCINQHLYLRPGCFSACMCLSRVSAGICDLGGAVAEIGRSWSGGAGRVGAGRRVGCSGGRSGQGGWQAGWIAPKSYKIPIAVHLLSQLLL